MTFPTTPTVAAGRVLTAVQANATATRTFPSLTGLVKNSGDLLIAIVVGYNTSVGTNAAFSGWTGGFTEFHDSATNGTMPIGMAYKWSDGTETGTFAVTQATTITGHAGFILMSIEGAHASTPPEAGGRASGVNSNADPGSLGPVSWGTDDTLWIAVCGVGETATGGAFQGILGGPASYTDLAVTGISADVVGGLEGGVAFRQLTADTQDPAAYNTDTSNARWGALTIGVRPGAAAAQPVYMTATSRYIQKVQLVGPFSSVISVLTVESGADIDGSLAATAGLTADVASIIGADGSRPITAALTADAVRALAADGNMAATAALSADVATVISSEGTLAATVGLSADASVGIAPKDIDGSLAVTAATSGDVSSVIGVDAALPVTVGLSADASVAGAISIDGTLATTAATNGDVASIISADGTLVAAAGLTATADVVGQANIDGALAITVGLTADATAVLTADGTLPITAGLSADAVVVPALQIDGALPVTAGLTASVASVIGVDAALVATADLTATAEVVRLVTIDGALVVTAATAADAFSAAPTVPRPPSGFVDRPFAGTVPR